MFPDDSAKKDPVKFSNLIVSLPFELQSSILENLSVEYLLALSSNSKLISIVESLIQNEISLVDSTSDNVNFKREVAKEVDICSRTFNDLLNLLKSDPTFKIHKLYICFQIDEFFISENQDLLERCQEIGINYNNHWIVCNSSTLQKITEVHISKNFMDNPFNVMEYEKLNHFTSLDKVIAFHSSRSNYNKNLINEIYRQVKCKTIVVDCDLYLKRNTTIPSFLPRVSSMDDTEQLLDEIIIPTEGYPRIEIDLLSVVLKHSGEEFARDLDWEKIKRFRLYDNINGAFGRPFSMDHLYKLTKIEELIISSRLLQANQLRLDYLDCSNLKILKLTNVTIHDGNMLIRFQKLKILHIIDCDINNFVDTHLRLPMLITELIFTPARKIFRSLDEFFKDSPHLETITINNNIGIMHSIPDSLKSFRLEIVRDCPNFVSDLRFFIMAGSRMPNLKEVELICDDFKLLQESDPSLEFYDMVIPKLETIRSVLREANVTFECNFLESKEYQQRIRNHADYW